MPQAATKFENRRVCETRVLRQQQSQNMAKSLSPTF